MTQHVRYPTTIHDSEAGETLLALLRSRAIYQKAFDRDYVSPEEVIVQVVQNTEACLVLCDSRSTESAVYHPARRLIQTGYCDGPPKPLDLWLSEITPLAVRSILNTEAAPSTSLSPSKFASKQQPEICG